MSEQDQQKVIEALRDVLLDNKIIEGKLFNLLKKRRLKSDVLTVALTLLDEFEDEIRKVIDELEKGKKGRFSVAFTQEHILEGITEILCEAIGTFSDEVQREKRFIEDLDIDALSMCVVLEDVEKRFAVTIADADVKTFQTVGVLADYIFNHQSQTSEQAPTLPFSKKKNPQAAPTPPGQG